MDIFAKYDQDRNENSEEKEVKTEDSVNEMNKDQEELNSVNETNKTKETPNEDTKEDTKAEVENVSSQKDKNTITYQDYVTQLNSHYGKKLDFVATVGGNMVVNYHNHVVLRLSLTNTDDPLIKYDDNDLKYLYDLTITLAATPVEQRGNIKNVGASNLKVWGV